MRLEEKKSDKLREKKGRENELQAGIGREDKMERQDMKGKRKR